MADTGAGPRDAAVMEAILREMGVEDYEPNVIHQMLEFSYRYLTGVLEDAKVYSEHAQKKELDVADVKLAIQNKMDHSFTSPPPRDFLIEIARKKNAIPLPLIPEKFGPRLPPERYCLTATNCKVKEKQKQPVIPSSQGVTTTFRLPLAKTTPTPAKPTPLLQSNTPSTPTSMPTLLGFSQLQSLSEVFQSSTALGMLSAQTPAPPTTTASAQLNTSILSPLSMPNLRPQ